MDQERYDGGSEGGAPAGDYDGGLLEFDEDPLLARRGLHRMWRTVWRVLPVMLLIALLLAVAGQPGLALMFHRSDPAAPVMITVVCEVPWAVVRVDNRGPASRCMPSDAGALPMARLLVSVGDHTLVATADGFAPYTIYIIAHPNTPGLYLTQFALTPSGYAQILDAVNDYFANAYTQDAIFPATLWQALGLRHPPSGSSLVVRERFEASALDSYEPFYTETTYLRPVTPEQGAVGVAVVVVDHVTIYDDCGTTPVLERRTPVLYKALASVILSLRHSTPAWVATHPYALNPDADISAPPSVAAMPATPERLLALAARTALSNQSSGSLRRLTQGITVEPLVSAENWADGAVLTLVDNGSQSPHLTGAQLEAAWLYMAGQLLALTPAAQALTPDALAIGSPAQVNDLRASLANQPSHICERE